MQAHKGDVLRFTGRAVGSPEHRATVVEVLGANGEPPYRVRYEDGHETEIYPGPGCVTETPAGAAPARTDAPRHTV
ncbi:MULTISPECIES: DUF1918 domain-containing protein [Streptomyces]|uniref:DUF1918 domain-containing protein n=1 Tax=Streptomyces TaxID=1883 RepID=UPI001966BBC7|nr:MULTISPECIES: DUF1918 domain-containing protein [Streptomyces]QRX95493.1 DUF1918 domain-containing protein [Streptomyces noursei]UJB45663.1 DUF1918 domain-containing protein [Streptomyces sp. A1-5]